MPQPFYVPGNGRVRRVSLKRQKANRERQKVVQQQPTLCEARLEGCWYAASDTHEIRTRARGGSITDKANCVALCRPCHQRITLNSGTGCWAQRHGWVVSSWDDEGAEKQARLLRALWKHCDLTCERDHRA